MNVSMNGKRRNNELGPWSLSKSSLGYTKGAKVYWGKVMSEWAEVVKNFELRKLELQREKNDNFKKQEKETEEILKRNSKARMDEMLKKIRMETT